MNTRKITVRILLYLFLMASLMIAGCGGGGGGDATGDTTGGVTFAQPDLEGTWDVHRLVSGDEEGWWRGTVTSDASGHLTFADCFDESGSTTCPAAGMVWTINTTTGVITESGTGSDPDNNYKMAANKKFIAGTQDQGTNPALLIAQKKVTGTSYSADDLQGKTFVGHSLMVGGSDQWAYDDGSTDGTGAVTIAHSTTPSGTGTPGDTGCTLVNTNGVITMTGASCELASSYQGFLSEDKRTIVGTYTEEGPPDIYHLMIIQITNDQNSATNQAAGTAYGHALIVGNDPAPFWAHQTLNISILGAISYSDWACSNTSVTLPATSENIAIAANGEATISGSDFHGQASFDGTFMVGTRTFTDVYSLMVISK